jgi:cytochrome c
MRALAGALFAAALLLASRAPGGEGFGRLEGHGGPVHSIDRSPDGALILTTSFDYSAGLWDAHARTLVRWLEGHDAAVTAGIFTPDGARALTGSDDFSLILWDVKTGAALHRFKGHQGKIADVAISRDGALAASAGWDGRIGLWDLRTPGPAEFLEGHRAGVNAVAFSADGRTLWSASQDGAVRRWDVAAKRFVRIEAEHGFGVNLLALNEAAGWLAYGALDGAVRVLDLATGAEIADITAGRPPTLALALSPDSGLIAVGDGEGYINVTSTRDWTTERDFRAVTRGPVWALEFSRDGAELYSAGLDSFVQIWPLATAASVASSATLRPFQRAEGPGNGERQFVRKCSICHSLTADGGRRAGPTLRGVFGRRAGTVAGYDYSDALDGSGIVWSAETISALFEFGPDHYTPGSKMPMQRITRPQDRADLVAYLRQVTAPTETIP